MRLAAAFAACLLASHIAAAAPVKREWSVDGVKREALVQVPAAKAGVSPPVVFVFHGHGGTMTSAARSMNVHAHWPDAVVVYPQGLPTPGKLTDPDGKKTGWQHSPGDQADRDLKFFDAALASVVADYKADAKRVYATGHSNGGRFTYVLWAARGDKVAAVAPSASPAGAYLKGAKPKPCLHVAGRGDPLVSFASQDRTMTAVAKLNGCATAGTPWAKAGDLDGRVFASPGGTPLVKLVHPGDHKYPAEAPGLIVKFFQEQGGK